MKGKLIENWCVVSHPLGSGGSCLNGIARRSDGGDRCVTTSPIREAIRPNTVVTHSGTRYILGTPARDYAKMHPYPRARLMRAFEKKERTA